jgi:putative component of toxin-antitoxin plasmid stabilization module
MRRKIKTMRQGHASSLIVLMGGSEKSDQSAEIKSALALVREYKQRKKQLR